MSNSNDLGKSLGIGFSIFISILLLLILAMIVNGWVLTFLWAWFVVPFGVSQISLPHAIGIAMLCGFLTPNLINLPNKADMYKALDQKEAANSEFAQMIVVACVYPFLTLLVGYIVSTFITPGYFMATGV